MKFKAGQRRKALEYEKDLVVQWKQNKTFEKSVENRSKDDAYVFYDGPPFITGVPHHGTLLSSVVKDAVPRYWTMQGKRVERVWGWDCHGLPAEVFTEKKLGIQDKRDIGTKISLEEYITTCRDNMVQTGDLWESTIDRIGRWVDFRGAYKTMDKDFMESVWWAFQKLYNEGKIYEGEKVLLYCTRDATPISKAEVAMDNSYQDVTDPSVFVKFKLKNNEQRTMNNEQGSPVYLLAWTTTPWTLNSNTAIGVGEDETYAEVKMEDGTYLILLAGLVEKVLTDEKHQLVPFETIRNDIKGRDLVGLEYEPLLGVHRGENAHKVWNYPGLSTEEGSGIVHLAPAYGEEDYALSKANGFPFVIDIDDSGFYTEGEWKGQNVWEANKPIAKELKERGVVWKIDYVKHSYPHCHRCGTKLMYRAHPSWFMDINGQREAMLEQNENINWFPEHVKHGRFEKTVESAPDWNLSRDRFWATAMPVWKSEDGDVKVVGSYAELKELSGVELDDYHRPWVDDIEFDFEGKHYKRIDKVLDCWFESGSMPFAQFHYPFENKEKFEQGFPGDFIAEYVGQVRAWFYYLHSVSIGLFGENSFKNVIVTGTVAGNDGRKMSKSFGNFTDPNELMDMYSADALRFLLLSSPLLNGEDFSLLDKDVQDVQRKLAMVWNMYDFFTMYADVDKWEWDGDLSDPLSRPRHSELDSESRGDANGILKQVQDDAKASVQDDAGGEGLSNPLDVWVVSRLHQLQQHVTEKMDGYDIPGALELVLPFLDDASNWYVRRSRRRFWKSGDDSDKNDAYTTLHYVLVRLSVLLAPFTPFLAEELYQKLTGGESVHLLDWPKAGAVDENIVIAMEFAKRVVNEGLSERAKNKLKARQPLARVSVFGAPEVFGNADIFFPIIKDELNVKDMDWSTNGDFKVILDLNITPELKREGLMRELIRQVQTARKSAGLNVDDRIVLEVAAEDEEVLETLREHGETIQAETLATSLEPVSGGYEATAKVDGFAVTIRLRKAV